MSEESARSGLPRLHPAILGGLLAALVLLPLVPCAIPVVLRSGDRWLFVEAGLLSEPWSAQMPYGALATDTPQGPPVTVFSIRRAAFPVIWRTDGSYHQRALHSGRFYYSVEWFRGKRIH